MTAPAELALPRSHTVSYWNVGFFGNSEEKTRGQLSVLRHDLVSCLSQLENNVVNLLANQLFDLLVNQLFVPI